MHYSKKEILAMTEGGFFGEGNAQLPSSLMLMIDEIGVISKEGGKFGKGKLEANLQILPDHWFFKCHFKETLLCPAV